MVLPVAFDGKRVAALAIEIASRLNLPHDVCDQVGAAAMHVPPLPEPGSPGFERLLHAVVDPVEPSAPAPKAAGEPIGGILEVARMFDSAVQSLVYEPRPISAILDDIAALAADGFLYPNAVSALQRMRAEAPSIAPSVYPAVLAKALALARNEDASLGQVEAVVRTDQALASSVLRVANSALYAPPVPIRTIKRALSRIDLDITQKTLLAAAAHSMFASARLRDLWRHSIHVAAIAEQLARTAGRHHPDEAFVSGLIHDIGRLVIATLPPDASATHGAIADTSGCVVFADLAVFGVDHGEIGAALLKQWNLPDVLVHAVEFHHRPELEPRGLAAVLHAAEFAAGSDEEAPSIARLRIAMDAAGVPSVGQMLERAAPDARVVDALAVAA